MNEPPSGSPLDEAKIEKLVELTEEAMEVADEIGRPVARAAYHLEAARLEAEAAAGNHNPLPRASPVSTRKRKPSNPS